MKVHELVDTFDAANPALAYGSAATRNGGRLSLALSAAFTGAVQSVEQLDLTASQLVVELVTVPTSVRSRVSVTLTNTDSSAEFLAWTVTHGTLAAVRYIEQTQTTGWSAPFDPAAHRWLAIRHEPGAVIWSTSPNGIVWTDRAMLSTSIPLDAMRLVLSAGLIELADPGDDDGVTPAPALLDNLNAAPVAVSDDPQTSIATDWAPNLAIDVLPTTGGEGTFVLDTSELDGFALLGWGSGADEWLNVVCDVSSVHIARGMTTALGPLYRAEAGSCTVGLIDTERRFDPTVNADAIHPGTPLRVRAWAGVDPSAPEWSAVLFTGRINGDGISVTYSQTEPPAVSVTASDVIASLHRWEGVALPDPGTGAGDDLLDRVQRVLDQMGIDDGLALAPDSTYTATLAPTDMSAAGQVLDAAVEAEQGQVWATVGNRLAVRARGAALAGPIRGTLSDWHGEAIGDGGVHCCYADPSVRYSPDQLVNAVIAGRQGGEMVVERHDLASQSRYERATMRATDLELETDEQLEAWATSLILGYTEPRVRVDAVTPTPWSAPEAWRAVALTDVGDRWYFRLHPQIGSAIRQAVGVLRIEHDITPDGWATRWATAWAPEPGESSTGWFLLNVSTLDGGDLLAPF